MSLLKLKNINIELLSKGGKADTAIIPLIKDISFEINEKEVIAVVGASGSGKTLTAYSILDLLPSGISITKGEIFYNEKNITLNTAQLRGKEIGIIFQEPFSALNPVISIGKQIDEVFLANGYNNKKEVKEKTIELLKKVRIQDAQRVYSSYAHNLSGGQRQRIIIAIAIAMNPRLLIADEPTTALDVSTQKEILDLLIQLKKEMDMSILFITHDLRIVKNIADKVIIMNKGAIVEKESKDDIFKKPKDQYTKDLLMASKHNFKSTPFDSPNIFIEAKRINRKFKTQKSFFKSKDAISIEAVSNVDLNVYKGKVTAIVGESGSGKSTLARILAGIDNEYEGEVIIDGILGRKHCFARTKKDTVGAGSKPAQRRKQIQMVFQDPYNSLDPGWRVKDIILEGMYDENSEQKELLLKDVLEKVHLNYDFSNRFAHQLSGGQRQRIAIARALITGAECLILDEPVSSLDVLIQKKLIEILMEIKDKNGLTYLIVSHDIKLVESIADYMYIMKEGCIVEKGKVNEVISNAKHEYTQMLINSI